MVHGRAQLLRPEKEYRVEVGNVDTPGVRHRTVGSVLLHVHAEEADIGAIDLFERENGLGFKWKRLMTLALVPILHVLFDLASLVHLYTKQMVNDLIEKAIQLFSINSLFSFFVCTLELLKLNFKESWNRYADISTQKMQK